MTLVLPQQKLRRVTFTCPMCVICDKEVDKFEMQRNGDYTTLVAYCHGDMSSSQPFKEEDLDRLYSYRAFQDPKRKVSRGRVIQSPNQRDVQGSWAGALSRTPR